MMTIPTIRRTFVWVMLAGVAFVSTHVHARISLTDLANQIAALRVTACGELDAAACAAAADPAILARIEALEDQIAGLEPVLCELAQNSAGAVTGAAIGCVIEPPSEAVDGDLRLADGASNLRGRLEVFNNGDWGTVCDDRFNNISAAVACRQLGHTSGIFVPISGTTIPRGTGAIFLDDVQCTGTETRLVDCSHRGIGVHNCSHFEDIALECE